MRTRVPRERLLELFHSTPPIRTFDYMDEEGQPKSLELHGEFRDIREVGTDEIWGAYRFEVQDQSQDLKGTTYTKPKTLEAEFFLVDTTPQFLIGAPRGPNVKGLVGTLNHMYGKNVRQFHDVHISGVMLTRFTTENPCTPHWALMHVNQPGLATVAMSGENLDRTQLYLTLRDLAAERDWLAVELHEYGWSVGLYKRGVVLDYSKNHTDEFLAFIRRRVLPLVSD